ncbi:SpoIID/LytB domain-containing protein [Nocardioides ferulae]|uniref:SpoIID/LytB domain-containing protein n=1 Tax=Nocardioides ferulae TaxID=2340821 RepID=UPI000EB1DAF6|nr:SpoIID/LytB domain-containing protein [Nocardioides ferulae]
MRLPRLLVAGAVAAATLATAPPATAAPDRWQVPSPATIVVRGHGYGHGHGMSQYGAEGAAREGLTYEQIAEFYYPGLRWGRARGRVTVQITADATDDLVVRPRAGLTVRDTGGDSEPVELPDNGAALWRVADRRDGSTWVAYQPGGAKKRWRAWRELTGSGEFAAGERPVTLVTPAGDRAYRGRLRAAPVGTDRVTVNDVALEDYLKGVVPLEIPALWSTEAVRAQAVAARTYAGYERAHPRSPAYQLCDTWSCQVYGGVDAEHPASNRAVRATRGRVLTHKGEPAFTQFGSSSGGWTAAGSVPYLVAQEDPYDGWSGNPNHTWSVTITDAALERAFPAVGDLRSIRVTRRDGNGDWGGRVGSLTLVGSSGRAVVSGDAMRSALGLRSTWFTFRVRR